MAEPNPELLRTYFRQATGADQKEKWGAAQARRWRISRALDAATFGSNQFIPSYHETHQGKYQLARMVEGYDSKRFPLTQLTYVADNHSGLRAFVAEAEFKGDQIGEEGNVQLEYTLQAIIVKAATESAELEVVKGQKVFHLPERFGVPIEARLTAIYGYRTEGTVGVWYPDITPEPVHHNSPSGKIDWSLRAR